MRAKNKYCRQNNRANVEMLEKKGKKNIFTSVRKNSRQTMPKMDPGEDIIDVLYNKPEPSQSSKSSGNRSMHRKSMLRRQYSNGLYQYGFEYQHPPTRNYYEDLFQIQRRNFHGSDSVYETANVTKRPLSRTDSIMEVKKI